MTLDHVGIWTNSLEKLKDYYVRYFNCRASKKYINKETHFESYFLAFESGAKIEIMTKPGIPENLNDRIVKQHQGIIHIAFGMESMEKVSEKAAELAKVTNYKVMDLHELINSAGSSSSFFIKSPEGVTLPYPAEPGTYMLFIPQLPVKK